MATTAPSKRQFQAPWNSHNAYDIKTWADIVSAGGIVFAMLSADASGRAVQAYDIVEYVFKALG